MKSVYVLVHRTAMKQPLAEVAARLQQARNPLAAPAELVRVVRKFWEQHMSQSTEGGKRWRALVEKAQAISASKYSSQAAALYRQLAGLLPGIAGA